MTTNNIGNDKESQRKRKRLDARAILTPYERDHIESAKGLGHCNRHVRYNVRFKTKKAINYDLPLIFAKAKTSDFLDYMDFYPGTKPYTDEFLKNLLVYYYRYELHH